MKLWIARDLVGIAKGFDPQLILSKEKPILMPERRLGMFFCDGFYVSLPKDWYPEVTFENSPMEVELVLIKKNQ